MCKPVRQIILWMYHARGAAIFVTWNNLKHLSDEVFQNRNKFFFHYH